MFDAASVSLGLGILFGITKMLTTTFGVNVVTIKVASIIAGVISGESAIGIAGHVV